jgi:hypothetical protein
MSNINWTERDRQKKLEQAKLAELAAPLARALGEGWSVVPPREGADPSPSYFDLAGPDGAKLSLHLGWQAEGKVSVGVSFDDKDKDGNKFWYLPHKVGSPSANISIDKTPQTFAADIKRRIFPEYLPLLADLNARRVEHNAKMDRIEDVAVALALTIGAELPTKSTDGYSHKVRPYHSSRLAGSTLDIVVTDGEVKFDSLRVSPFVAREILNLLIKHHVKSEE